MTWPSRTTRPGNWKSLKAKVLRDHGTVCHLCGHAGAETVDHVVNLATGGTYNLANLAPAHGLACPTCRKRCHVVKTQAEAQVGRPKMRREAEAHPGMLR